MEFLAFLSFLLSLAVLISWCVVVSRIGQIRDEAKRQTQIAEAAFKLQKRQTEALEDLRDHQRALNPIPPELKE